MTAPNPPGAARQPSRTTLPGKLVACPEPPWNGRVFYVDRQQRHWAPSVDHLACYGWSLADVIQVSGEEMRQYGLAGDVPKIWPEDLWDSPPRGSRYHLREFITSRLQGCGIEFGAGTSALPVPLGCEVRFADFVPEQDVRSRKCADAGNEFVRLHYVMGIEDPHPIADGSLDFVLASHIIEHVRNPLRAFESVFRKLKTGGQFVLVVPDKLRTFDRDRELTTLDHLVLDYESPDLERDKAHYREFFREVYNMPEEVLEESVEGTIAINGDTHFHTWTYETFGAMVEYSCCRMSPWKAVWSQPAIEGDPDSFEFYYVLSK